MFLSVINGNNRLLFILGQERALLIQQYLLRKTLNDFKQSHAICVTYTFSRFKKEYSQAILLRWFKATEA